VVWFRTGWRPSEILALRFDWLDVHRQTVLLRLGRIARWVGVEAPAKTGPREVDCRYDPEIFAAFERCRRAALATGRHEYVFTDQSRAAALPGVSPQTGLAPDAPALRPPRAYNIRDTFITNALSAGEDPGWVAQVCGTSEQMIFRHYRPWMPALSRTDGPADRHPLRASDMPKTSALDHLRGAKRVPPEGVYSCSLP